MRAAPRAVLLRPRRVHPLLQPPPLARRQAARRRKRADRGGEGGGVAGGCVAALGLGHILCQVAEQRIPLLLWSRRAGGEGRCKGMAKAAQACASLRRGRGPVCARAARRAPQCATPLQLPPPLPGRRPPAAAPQLPSPQQPPPPRPPPTFSASDSSFALVRLSASYDTSLPKLEGTIFQPCSRASSLQGQHG